MEIRLTPDLESFVRLKVDGGSYESANDLVLDALRLLQERDRVLEEELAELRREVAIGIEQSRRGEVGPFDPMGRLRRVKARLEEPASVEPSAGRVD